jgi:hypothetical protein
MKQTELIAELEAIAEQSYDQLTGKWLEWLEVAKRFEHKAKAEDRLDLRHNIIVAFAEQQSRNERLGNPDLSFYGMLRIASHCVADYWREDKRNGRLISLNMLVTDDEGNSVELVDTLADDSINLEAWLEASTWELGYPKRLVAIARKLDNGENLTPTDSQYLWRYRKRTQKHLL